MERYSQALSVFRYPSSSGQTHCDLITGMPEYKTSKENKTGNEVTCIMDKLLIHEDAENLTSGFVTYREATGIAHGNWRFTRIFIRMGIGVNMGVHGSDVDH